MRLSLEAVVPIPLREKVNSYSSGVWKQSLELKKGERVFVQAPSGTGKTTLIHILYGMRQDYTGTIYWNALNMAAINKEEQSNLRANYLSVIFQDMRLFPELTAWENLEVKRRLTDTATEQQVEAWLARLGVKDKRDSLARTLSYGEQQRIAIIRALLQPFEWLLMDEPFSHLDINNRNKAIELIAEVVEMNSAGMILADLDENEYFPYSRRIWL
ncbi:MAG TPA: ATP-binding cassette domain-containing protein [Flavipsychrobacter sp.]|nr:ATP-binding cassette domain-containing protein [Flavipsychrobacter sp.]